jgi:hypothetical protein
MISFGEANPEGRKKERKKERTKERKKERKSILLKKNLHCTVDLQ